jgi:cytochrome c peroxidase
MTSSGLMSDTVPEAIAGPNGTPIDSIDRGYSIRSKVLDRINAVPTYVDNFSAIYPSAANGNISFAQIAAAIAEFEITLTFADAPLDQFARGQVDAMTDAQKRGALLFFGKVIVLPGNLMKCLVIFNRMLPVYLKWHLPVLV